MGAVLEQKETVGADAKTTMAQAPHEVAVVGGEESTSIIYDDEVVAAAGELGKFQSAYFTSL